MENGPPAPVFAPAPLRRRPSFWIGLFCVVFTGWVWVDSVRYDSVAVHELGSHDRTGLGTGEGLLEGVGSWGRDPKPSTTAPWFFFRTHSNEPFAERFLKYGLKIATSRFRYTRVPWTTGSFYTHLEIAIPAWMPLGCVIVAWTLIHGFAGCRRRRVLARSAIFGEPGMLSSTTAAMDFPAPSASENTP